MAISAVAISSMAISSAVLPFVTDLWLLFPLMAVALAALPYKCRWAESGETGDCKTQQMSKTNFYTHSNLVWIKPSASDWTLFPSLTKSGRASFVRPNILFTFALFWCTNQPFEFLWQFEFLLSAVFQQFWESREGLNPHKSSPDPDNHHKLVSKVHNHRTELENNHRMVHCWSANSNCHRKIQQYHLGDHILFLVEIHHFHLSPFNFWRQQLANW